MDSYVPVLFNFVAVHRFSEFGSNSAYRNNTFLIQGFPNGAREVTGEQLRCCQCQDNSTTQRGAIEVKNKRDRRQVADHLHLFVWASRAEDPILLQAFVWPPLLTLFLATRAIARSSNCPVLETNFFFFFIPSI
jgi:hypothetical protein